MPGLVTQEMYSSVNLLPLFGRCDGSKQFDIDWGHYLDQDAEMLTLGGTESVVATGLASFACSSH